MTGTVVALKLENGFCFVKPDGKNEPDVFAHKLAFRHARDFGESLMHARVAFDISVQADGRSRAIDVRLA